MSSPRRSETMKDSFFDKNDDRLVAPESNANLRFQKSRLAPSAAIGHDRLMDAGLPQRLLNTPLMMSGLHRLCPRPFDALASALVCLFLAVAPLAKSQAQEGVSQANPAKLSDLYSSLNAWSQQLQKKWPAAGATQDEIHAFNKEYALYSAALEEYKRKSSPPVLPAKGRMEKPAEVLSADDAMTVAEISLLIGSGLPQTAVLEDVRRRGLVDAASGADLEKLSAKGAGALLLKELNNYNYVITDQERVRYFERVSKRGNSAIVGKRSVVKTIDPLQEKQAIEKMSQTQLSIFAEKDRESKAENETIQIQKEIDALQQQKTAWDEYDQYIELYKNSRYSRSGDSLTSIGGGGGSYQRSIKPAPKFSRPSKEDFANVIEKMNQAEKALLEARQRQQELQQAAKHIDESLQKAQ